jgi:two-component system sensor histidine kinase QseC
VTSLRGRLILRLALAMSLTAMLIGGLLFGYLARVLERDFDRTLNYRAHALRSLVAIKPDGRWDIDVHPMSWREYADPASGEFYRVFDDQDHTITASATDPLRGVAVPPEDHTALATLASGTKIHLTSLRYQPSIEPEEGEPLDPKRVIPRPFATVLVARSVQALDGHLWHIAVSIAAAVVLLIVMAILATIFVVRAGLAGLVTVADQMAAVDFSKPDAAIQTHDIPTELAGVADRFNDMVGRIVTTLSRERRFTADVAHELRTPIAELRLATDVALRFRDKPGATERGLERANQIAERMQGTMEALLAFVRSERLDQVLQPTEIDLAAMIGSILAGRVPRPGVTGSLPHVSADVHLLRAVLENLIGNAFDHTSDPASVRIDGQIVLGRAQLSIENAQSSLTPTDLPQLTDAFVRKDSARSQGAHLGLGLSLTQRYCLAMGLPMKLSLPTPNSFRVSLELPLFSAGAATHFDSEHVAADQAEGLARS